LGTASAAGTTVAGSTNKIGACLALVVGCAASANVAGDGEVAEPADADRGQHSNVDAAAVASVVPAVPECFDDNHAAGETVSAHHDGRVADQYQWPDLLGVGA
jgi:hypothetical protein